MPYSTAAQVWTAYEKRDYPTVLLLISDPYYLPNKSSVVADIVVDALSHVVGDSGATRFVVDMMRAGHPVQPEVRREFTLRLVRKDRRSADYFLYEGLITRPEVLQVLKDLQLYDDRKLTTKETDDAIALIHWMIETR